MPFVTDVIRAREDEPGSDLVLRRDVRSFFQGNRFLLEELVRHVVERVGDGPVIDLYAGVGLFGLAVAAAGADEAVTLVEGDPVSSADLAANAEPLAGRVAIRSQSVEQFLREAAGGRGAEGSALLADATVIVDPPRTGLSGDAAALLARLGAQTIVYVSCDPATLARDARVLHESGYALEEITGFDLFPNTAHIETVVTFQRG